MRHSIIITSAVVSAITSVTFGATILVPDEYGSIQSGIDAAIAGDTVLVSAGIYYETIDFGGKEITLLSADGEPSGTFIDGNVSSGSVVSFITGETNLSILDGFTIRNGSATSGGGVYIQSASPILRNCVISGNSATGSGGGIFIDSGTLTLENTTVTGNTSNSAGGGAYVRFSEGSLLNSTFENNSAVNGGAVYVKDGSGDLLFTNVVVQGNSATASGGGVFDKASNIIVGESAFTNNMANKGGGWFSYGAGNATISNTTFVGNSVSEGGGAANIRSVSIVSFIQCTFDTNVADDDCDGVGGSGAIDITSNSSVTLDNPTICVNLVCDVIEDFSGAQPTIIGDISGCSSGLGACCGGTACWVMDYNSCLEGGGVFNGEDTVCAMVNCMDMDAGACCLDNQCILVITSAACTDAGGDFQGELVECIDVVCLGCPADINGDGAVEVNDVIEVITAWGACP